MQGNLALQWIAVVFFMFLAMLIAIIYDRKKFQYQYNNMRRSYIHIIMALASAIDTRDPSSIGHAGRVMELSQNLALAMQKRGYKIDIESLKLAALLHDVGKIGISDELLRKPGVPTRLEWDQIRKHPDLGADILKPLDELRPVKDAVRHHQEHYDGLGYPAGLRAKDIPIMSRIIMVIDAYDAIVSGRSYKAPRSKKEALGEIKANSGTQFDPDVVSAFIDVMKPDDT